MKNLFIVIAAIMVISSCSSTKEATSSKTKIRNEKKIAEQETIRDAVESRRFLIKFERAYFSHGGIVDLIPKANYIIIDRNKVILSAAYIGRQYDIRPIEGINMRAETSDYELTSDSAKGLYEIRMKVTSSGNTFHVYLTVNKDGFCNVSLTNIRIDYIQYSGHIVPIKVKPALTPQEGQII